MNWGKQKRAIAPHIASGRKGIITADGGMVTGASQCRQKYLGSVSILLTYTDKRAVRIALHLQERDAPDGHFHQAG